MEYPEASRTVLNLERGSRIGKDMPLLKPMVQMEFKTYCHIYSKATVVSPFIIEKHQ